MKKKCIRQTGTDSGRRKHRRRWFQFSLRTLLLSYVVLALLMGCVVLPLIQEAREEARRVRCPDAVKQLGIATSNYVATYQSASPTNGANQSSPAADKREE